MIKYKNFVLIILAVAFFVSFSSSANNDIDLHANSHQTKFGLVKYSYPFVQVSLNGKLFFQARNMKVNTIISGPDTGKKIYTNGNAKDLIYSDFSLYEEDFSLDMNDKSKNSLVERIVLSEGNAGCAHRLFIMDFTGDKPFISEPFGNNPGEDETACIKFVGAKWGKKESYITIDNSLKYIYHTGGKIFGPL